MIKMQSRYAEFIMVSVKAEKPGVGDYYISVPEKALLAAFDGFEAVSEDQLPREIDAVWSRGRDDNRSRAASSSKNRDTRRERCCNHGVEDTRRLAALIPNLKKAELA
jgi:hypothetical protein